MAEIVVSFDGVRVNDSNSSTSWGNWGSSGGAPSSESPLAYQGSLTVNKKINSSTLGGIDYDPGSDAVDMTLASRKLWFIKLLVADSFDLDPAYGVAVGIGSANNAFHKYNVAGSGSALPVFNRYPPQGGYLITALDPTISAWRDSTSGTPSIAAVAWFGVQADFIVGAAKAENLALDAIDIGTGLTLTGGDGVSERGTYTSYVSTDQDVTSNRWGVVTGEGDTVKARGILKRGGATPTGFNDETSVVTFPDGYHSAGLVGVLVQLDNATSEDIDGALLIGEGSSNGLAANDTRPDYIVTGTSAVHTHSAQTRNFRNVTFTSACVVTQGSTECQLLTQGSAAINDHVVRTNALSGVACLQDATFTSLGNVRFIQSGSGHAIEITTAGSYTLNELYFVGYGGSAGSNATANSGETDAAIFNNSGGVVTLNVDSGDSPSIRNGPGSTTVVVNSVTLTITGMPLGSELTITDSSDPPVELFHVEASATGSEAYTYDSGAAGTSVVINVIPDPATDGDLEIYSIDLELSGDGATLPVNLSNDRVYTNS